MNLDFHWINLLILFGAVQALLFSIILIFNKTHPGSKFLSIFIFVLAYNGFETFNWSSGLDRYYLFFDMFSYIVIYALGPSLYLYMSSLLNPIRKIPKRVIAAHFGFTIFHLVLRILVIIYHLLWINKIIKSDVSSNDIARIIWLFAEPLSVSIFIAYLVATIYKFAVFTRSGKFIPSIYPDAQLVVTRWIKALLTCMSVFAIVWVLTVIAPYLVNMPFSHYYPVELGLVFFIYWMALNGYHKMKLIYLPTAIPKSNNPARRPDAALEQIGTEENFKPGKTHPHQESVSAQMPVKPGEENFDDRSTKGSDGNPDEAGDLALSDTHNKDLAGQNITGDIDTTKEQGEGSSRDNGRPRQKPGNVENGLSVNNLHDNIPDHDKYFLRIRDAMEQSKLFLDPELNLAKLSAHTGIPSKQISAILNQYQQTNFNDFINSYRVAQVSLLMLDPSSRNLTISSLAMDAGFNSHATFQRAFKKHTGISPRQFIARSLKNPA